MIAAGASARFSVHLGRMSFIFRIVSALAAISLTVSLVCSVMMLLGDHPVLTPIVPESSEAFPPPGILPKLHLASIFAALVFLSISVVVWLFWLTSSSQFVRRAGARNMRFSPVMSSVWHFIPVMSYVMPMLVMVELEAATRNPQTWRDDATSLLASTTWLVARLAAIGFSATFGLSDRAETAAEYVQGLWLSSIAGVFVLAGLILANRFIKNMRELQVRLVETRV